MSSVAVEQGQWTYRDLVALPDDRARHELIDGEHIVSPSPGTAHQQVLLRLGVALYTHVEREGCGEVLFAPFVIKLSLFTVLVPDLVYFTTERFAHLVNDKHATAAPDLVVEVASPGTRRRDKGRKRAVYDREGVREYWIADPEACHVTMLLRPSAGAGLTSVITLTTSRNQAIESPLFPGLLIALRDIFRSR